MTILLFVQGLSASAQIIFSLRPYAGIQFPFAKIEDNTAGVHTFKNNQLNLSADYSLFLEANIRGKSRLLLGYTNWGMNGTQFDILHPQPSSSNNPKAASVTWGLSENIHKLQLRYAHRLTRIALFAKKRTDLSSTTITPSGFNLYIEPFMGVSADFVNPATATGRYLFPIPLEFYGDTINNIAADIVRTRKQGFSLQTGINFQFAYRGKDRLALTLYYNQGLARLNNYEVIYYISSERMPGEYYHTLVSSRASTFGINLSYPIRLWTVGKGQAVSTENSESVNSNRDEPQKPLKTKDYRKNTFLAGINAFVFSSSLAAARAGYFVANNFLLGLEAYYIHSRQDDLFYTSTTTNRGIGLIGRYYVGTKKVAPFLQAGFFAGDYNFDDITGGRLSRKYNTTFVHLFPGVSIRVWGPVKLDVGVQFVDDRRRSGPLDDLLPHIGLHYTLTSL